MYISRKEIDVPTPDAFPHFGTDAIHAGQPADEASGAVMLPITLSTTFLQPSPGKPKSFMYSRY